MELREKGKRELDNKGIKEIENLENIQKVII